MAAPRSLPGSDCGSPVPWGPPMMAVAPSETHSMPSDQRDRTCLSHPTGIAVLSSVTLQIQGFDAVSGIAIVVVCLTLSQIAYLAAGWVSLSDKKTDKEPRDRGDNDVARDQHQRQRLQLLA